MRLLLVNEFYPPDEAPTGLVLHDVAKSLVARGHTVSVLCSRRSYNGGRKYPAREERDGVSVVRVPSTGRGRRSLLAKSLDYASFYVSVAFRLITSRTAPPDLVLALTTPPLLGSLAMLMSSRSGPVHARWVMDLHPDVMVACGVLRENGVIARLLSALARYELRRTSLVIVPGAEVGARVCTHVAGGKGPDIVEVPLWPPADLLMEEPGAAEFLRKGRGWSPEETVLMYSGNMGLAHRFGEFLAAAARTAVDPRLRWVFVGDGRRRREVVSFAEQNPHANITLLPPIGAAGLGAHLRSADVHLVSLDSQSQGCMVPSKLQGIFSVGRPIIFVGGTDNAAARWIAEADAGWIVAENDVDALVRVTKEEAVDPAGRDRRGHAAMTFAHRHFDRAANTGKVCDSLELLMCPGA